MQKKNSAIPSQDFESYIVDMLAAETDSNSSDLNHHLERLYANCDNMIKKISYNFSIDMSIADDLFQDAMELLIKKIRTGKFVFKSRNQLYSWFSKVLENYVRSLTKKQNNNSSLNDEDHAINCDGFTSEQPEHCINKIIAPSCSLEERLTQIFEENLSPQGAKVLKLAMIDKKSNEEGAREMGYGDESIFRKKKSQHLGILREKISARQREELIRLAS